MKKIIKFLLTITVGATYGLLFAKRSGKKFREDLQESKKPVKTFFNEFKDVDLEAIETIRQWAKESEDVQKILEIGKNQFDEFVKKAKHLSKGGKEMARKKLEELSHEAHKAAEELKSSALKKGTDLKEELKKEEKTIIKK